MTHNQVWNAIDRFAQEHNLSCAGLARLSQMDATVFNKSKRFYVSGRPRWLSLESIAKVLNATDTRAQDFFRMVDQERVD